MPHGAGEQIDRRAEHLRARHPRAGAGVSRRPATPAASSTPSPSGISTSNDGSGCPARHPDGCADRPGRRIATRPTPTSWRCPRAPRTPRRRQAELLIGERRVPGPAPRTTLFPEPRPKSRISFIRTHASECHQRTACLPAQAAQLAHDAPPGLARPARRRRTSHGVEAAARRTCQASHSRPSAGVTRRRRRRRDTTCRSYRSMGLARGSSTRVTLHAGRAARGRPRRPRCTRPCRRPPPGRSCLAARTPHPPARRQHDGHLRCPRRHRHRHRPAGGPGR